MKKTAKRILSLALALMTLPAPVMAPQLFSISESITAEAATYDNQTITISGVTYQKKTGYGCTWEDGAIAIKAANQNTITIQSSITLQKSDKTSVTVPVTEIGDNFASGLTALKTLTIPSSVEKIGSHVAYNCRWLSNVKFNTTKVEHLDSSFLYGSEYYDNKISANRSTGHVWVGEWLLKYNPNATSTSVTVTSIPGKKQIKKIADQAFVACSPKLTTVDLSGITHIGQNGLGARDKAGYQTYIAQSSGHVMSFQPNSIADLKNTAELISVDTSALEGTLYYCKEYAAHKYDKNYYPMVLGKVLYQIIPGSNTKQTTLDLSAAAFDKMKSVQFISCSLKNEEVKFTKIVLPNDFVKFTVTYVNDTTICDMDKITSFRYFNNANSTTSVELKDVITKCALNNGSLTAKDKAFINNNIVLLTGGTTTDSSLTMTSGYRYQIVKPLGERFLKDKCKVNPSVKPTEAWSQYNVIRKTDCGIRNTIPYQFYHKGGSGNAAAELIRVMTGISDRRGIVCRDYADLFQFLMRLMGISTQKITSSGHEWNIVRIFDTAELKEHWFNIDTTYSWNVYNTNFMSSDNDIMYNNTSHARKRDPYNRYGTKDTWKECKEGRGDVNLDGKVDKADANLITKAYMAELCGSSCPLTRYQKVLADVDCNGEVDTADATLIMQFDKDVTSGKINPNNPKASNYKDIERFIREYFDAEDNRVFPI